MPYASLASWPDALDDVRAAGFTVLALTPGAHAVPLNALTAAQRERPALLFGAEGPGLTLAAASAVAFWELIRDSPPGEPGS